MSASNAIVVASAARTPVGSFNGAFANVPAHELGAVAVKEVLVRAGVDPKEVDEVILGQILTAGSGQNPARQAAINAGIPNEATAWGLNQLCGSGLRAIAIGMQQIAAGDAKIIVAGGQESMSMAPHAQYLRGGGPSDERGRGGAPGHHAAGAHRVLGNGGCRSADHGHGPDPGIAQGAAEAPARLRQGRLGDGRQCIRHQ